VACRCRPSTWADARLIGSRNCLTRWTPATVSCSCWRSGNCFYPALHKKLPLHKNSAVCTKT